MVHISITNFTNILLQSCYVVVLYCIESKKMNWSKKDKEVSEKRAEIKELR